MPEKKDALLKGLAEILEVDAVTEETRLEPWDSLNVMSAVVLVDEVYGKVVHGAKLQPCGTVADILAIAEA